MASNSITSIEREMLFIIGQFFKETDQKFAESPLKVAVSKAEFIDTMMHIGVVSKKERAIYKNLEGLGHNKMITYDEKNLKLTRKGLAEYEKTVKETDRLDDIRDKIKSERIRFKRKIQTKLNV